MTSLPGRWLRRFVVYPYNDRRTGRRIIEAFKSAWRVARMPEAAREQLSLERMRGILSHASAHVPYYRDLFAKSGIKAEGIRTWDDLARLPPLSKADIIAAGDRMLTSGLDKARLHLRRSGGSTGPAMHIYYDNAALDASSGVDQRSMELSGKPFGERVLHIVNRDPFPPGAEGAKMEKRRLWAVNHAKVLVDRMDDACLDRLLDEIDAVRAKWMNAYPSLLFLLAQRAKARGQGLRRRWKVVTTGETLFESQRQAAREQLGVEIFDRYGSAEFGVIAQECPAHQGLHVNTDHVHVELVPFGDAPDTFEIFVTTLTNTAMPLIRYRTEDLCLGGLVRGRCACGLDFPRFKKVQGRTHDVIHTPGGGRILSSFLQDTLLPFGGIRQFQLIQHDFDRLEFQYIPDADRVPDSLPAIQAHLATHLGAAMRVDLVRVETLPTSREGKLRYTRQTPEFREKLKALPPQ